MTGPRHGSMADRLLSMQPGDVEFFDATSRGPMPLQQTVCACAKRNGLTGKLKQEWFVSVQPTTREVIDIVRVTRLPDEEGASK